MNVERKKEMKEFKKQGRNEGKKKGREERSDNSKKMERKKKDGLPDSDTVSIACVTLGALTDGGIGGIAPPPAKASSSPSSAKKDMMRYTSVKLMDIFDVIIR